MHHPSIKKFLVNLTFLYLYVLLLPERVFLLHVYNYLCMCQDLLKIRNINNFQACLIGSFLPKLLYQSQFESDLACTTLIILASRRSRWLSLQAVKICSVSRQG